MRGQMQTSEVLCYGEIGIDNIIQTDGLPSPENAVFPTSDSYHGGGAASNTAVWLANLGVKVKLTGNAIGHDPYGELILEGLRRQPNIDLSLVEQRAGVTTPFTRALVTPDGERSFVIFWYPQAPKVPLSKEMLEGIKYRCSRSLRRTGTIGDRAVGFRSGRRPLPSAMSSGQITRPCPSRALPPTPVLISASTSPVWMCASTLAGCNPSPKELSSRPMVLEPCMPWTHRATAGPFSRLKRLPSMPPAQAMPSELACSTDCCMALICHAACAGGLLPDHSR